jgi:hypothetical protein
MTTVTPQAIDAYVFIDSIRVVGRHRKDLGDLDGLSASIADVGLLNPITITGDSRLVAGQRRIEACRRLGWDSVPVRIVSTLDQAAILLRAERDENTQRKDMLLSEKASLGEALSAIETAHAEERQRDAGRNHGRGIACDPAGTTYSSRDKSKVRTLVGEALGLGGTNYGELRYVFRLANDAESEPALKQVACEALAEMDRTGQIRPIAERVRARVRANEEAAEVMATALAGPADRGLGDGFVVSKPAPTRPEDQATPTGRDKSPVAAARRRELIHACAVKGMSSEQIGHQLDILPGTVRRIARDQGIAIPADRVMGRVKKKIDSNRIIRETVQTLEGLEMGLNLVDFDELDPAEIGDWTASLSDSIRRLNRLNKRLKEKAQ